MAGVHIKRRLSSCACLPLLPSRRPTLTPSVLPISTACVKTACDIIAVSSGRDLRIPPPTSLTPAVHLRTTHLAPTCSSSPVWTKSTLPALPHFQVETQASIAILPRISPEHLVQIPEYEQRLF